MKLIRTLFAWATAALMLLWRFTCRYSIVDDPRPTLRMAQRPYVYALLHAHQLAAVFINDEPLMAAMVSRSDDGDLLVPALKLRRVIAVRGSTRKQGRDKGGREALTELGHLVAQRIPALLAIDGPRGPRNYVNRGITDIARETHAIILPVVVVPSRRWELSRTWDRFQIPKPFSRIEMRFGTPIDLTNTNPEHDETTRQHISRNLVSLENAANQPTLAAGESNNTRSAATS